MRDPFAKKGRQTDSVIINPNTNKAFNGRDRLPTSKPIIVGQNNNANGLVVRRLTVNKTNQYHDHYYRNFESVLDDSAINDFSDTVDLSQALISVNSTFAPVSASVSRLANRFIKPRMDVDKRRDAIPIKGSHKEPRFVFIMEITKEVMSGISEVYIVTGFTDRLDYSIDRMDQDIVYIAEDTEFYVNNVITMQETESSMHGYGSNESFKLKKVDQLLYENPFADRGYKSNLTTITPYDVATRLQISHLDDENVQGITLDGTFRNGTASTKAQSSIKLSRRGNTNVSEFVGRLIGGHVNGVERLKTGQADEFNVWDTICSDLAENKIRSNPLFNVLRDSTNLETDKCFTFRDLVNISPDIDDVTEVNLGNKRRNNLDTEYHSQSTMAYQIGLRIAQAMPSLLTSCALDFICFEVHNHTIDEDFVIIIDPDGEREPKPFAPSVNDELMVRKFKNRLSNEVLNGLLENDMIELELYVEASLTDEIYIEVGFNGEKPVPWAYESFCDNLSSPILCNGENNRYIDDIANDLNHVYGAISDLDDDSRQINRSSTFMGEQL